MRPQSTDCGDEKVQQIILGPFSHTLEIPVHYPENM